jgi:secondary thiamine-phosphate synthase enzyme
MIILKKLSIDTQGRGTYDVTQEIRNCVGEAGIRDGLCHIFVHHTSASLMLCENADPSVRRDLESFMSRIAPDGDPAYEHSAEGPDDMPAHIRSVLTQTGISIPIENGRPALGTWQGLYLWEHRHHAHQRKLTVTVMGEGDGS